MTESYHGGWNSNIVLAAAYPRNDEKEAYDPHHHHQQQQQQQPLDRQAGNFASTSYQTIERTLKSTSSSPSAAHASNNVKSRACDSCRKRKIKCLRLNVEGIEAGSNVCLPCRSIGSKCTYAYIPKRPGPQTTKTKKQKRFEQDTSETAKKSREKGKKVKHTKVNIDVSPAANLAVPDPPTNFTELNTLDNFPLLGRHGQSCSTSLVRPHIPLKSPTASLPYHLFPASSPTISKEEKSQNKFTTPISLSSLEDIAPRQTFIDIVDIYYRHLYPLCPLVHRPSFSHDLASCRDESDKEFLIFVLSLTSYTLVQAPRSVIPSPWSYYRKFHRVCHDASQKLQTHRYEMPRLIHLSTLYLDHIYLGSTGSNNAANTLLGEATRLCYMIGLQDERASSKIKNVSNGSSSTSPSLIEKELNRRVFFLLYGSDKTIALIQDQPICIRDDDIYGVEIPVAVDDDLISHKGISPQPLERGPSVLHGFATVSKLYLLLSKLLESYRRDQRRHPATLAEIQERKKFVGGMLKRVKAVLVAVPEALQTSRHLDEPRIQQRPDARDGWCLSQLTADGTQINARSSQVDMMEENNYEGSEPAILTPFAIMKVNLLITETMIRFAITEYTDLLNQLQEQHQPEAAHGIKATVLDNDWELAAKDMVETLQAMPFDSFAANGQSLVAKLLYLTSNLLNRSPAGTRGFQYLCNFLETLNKLTTDRNAGSNDDGGDDDDDDDDDDITTDD